MLLEFFLKQFSNSLLSVNRQQVEATRALSSTSQMTDSSDSIEVISDVCPECTQTTTVS